jgi:2-dehydro-3-deoxyphosphogluconate aldolase/(4S)-4-hydroxy-2-oxoglutarate aldolase
MARHSRVDTINAILDRGLVPRIKPPDEDTARGLITALADGGAPVIEFTHEMTGYSSLFSDLVRFLADSDPAVIPGAGGIADSRLAEDYMNAGACFISGTNFNSEIARACNRRKVPYIPVCHDADAVAAAEELGVEWIGLVGWEPEGVSQLLKERSWTRVMPRITDPVSLDNWIESRAACLNVRAEAINEAAASGRDWPALTRAVEDLLWKIRLSRGKPLFSGVEHVGLYPERGQAARDHVQWYVDTFGFDLFEGETYFFAHSSGPGRIEVLEDPEDVKAHVAVKVSNFEAGCRHLQELGIELEPPKLLGRVKAVFLKDRDPAGNKVHLIYQAI